MSQISSSGGLLTQLEALKYVTIEDKFYKVNLADVNKVKTMTCEIYQQDCEDYLEKYEGNPFDLAFLDPPFNQNKEYASHNDNMISHEYWDWMTRICKLIYEKSSTGASIYFMQREKNVHYVLNALETSGWEFQNLIIWKKKTSAVPSAKRYGIHYQIISFSAKGKQPRIFNKLRINPPLLVTEQSTVTKRSVRHRCLGRY